MVTNVGVNVHSKDEVKVEKKQLVFYLLVLDDMHLKTPHLATTTSVYEILLVIQHRS